MASTSEATGLTSEITSLTAIELSTAIGGRDLSCKEVMSAYLQQIDTYNPTVNAIISRRDSEALLQEASEKDISLAEHRRADTPIGWMYGFPQAPKDLTETAGLLTTHGSPIFANHVPTADSVLVERMRASGSILIGKTNVPEFGLGSHSFNPIFGATKNVFDQSKSAGGSSGGAAVSLALDMLPVADGSDFMGSLRNPAAWNNVVGFRPSAGRVPFSPAKDLFTQQYATEGPMARNVADLAMFLSVIAGHDARAPLSLLESPAVFSTSLVRDFKGARIGWLGDYNGYLPTEPGVMETCVQALKHFEAIGCQVDEALPNFSMQELWTAFLAIRGTVVAGGLTEHYLAPEKRALLKPEAVSEVVRGNSTSALDFFQASTTRSAWFLEMNRLLDTFDFLVLPSAQVFPFDIDARWPEVVGGRKMDTYHRWMEVVIGPTLAGMPALSVPAGFGTNGLPMGIQIIGRRNADFSVLQMGLAFEQASEYTKRRSPLLSK
ncbi:amidase [Burkholderia anthina]|uniref:amidase n=1 Tax=Burkholderia anthina TaxID=179879 RepID=UPI00158CA130|nr:amidase [Burkholderia anthina]